jgi:hypothetical protein
MAKKILMDFSSDGRVKIKAEGYEGGSCLEATKPFEDMFSGTEVARESTGECATGSDNGEYAR